MQFVKKIHFGNGNQMKKDGYDEKNGFYIKLSIHLLLKYDL